jgi:hypothetical protein
MPKTGAAVAKSKKAGALASSAKSRKAAEDRFVHHEDIAPHEFSAFKGYQGTHYADINVHLRQTSEAHLALPEAVATIPHLRSLIGKTSLARDTTLYRCIQAYAGFDPSQYKAGDVYHDKGFSSTSLKRSAAEGFTDKLTNPTGSVLLHIRAPKGTKALPAYKLGTGSSFQKSEHEVLLSPGSAIKITRVRQDKSGFYHFHGVLQ